tara:strand:+ start:1070 stop:1555 length:486 start_codon:yes stop_codon:yes gene_type:complete
MDYNNFINNITLYIDGDLTKTEKIEFEKAISENKEWENLYLDIKRNDELLKNLPQIVTKSDFIVRLNNKIDKYENKKYFSIIPFMKDYIFNIKPLPAFSILALVILISFSALKLSNFSFNPNLSEKDLLNNENYIAINDSDSLKSDKDSLNYPILLIGNGR